MSRNVISGSITRARFKGRATESLTGDHSESHRANVIIGPIYLADAMFLQISEPDSREKARSRRATENQEMKSRRVHLALGITNHSAVIESRNARVFPKNNATSKRRRLRRRALRPRRSASVCIHYAVLNLGSRRRSIYRRNIASSRRLPVFLLQMTRKRDTMSNQIPRKKYCMRQSDIPFAATPVSNQNLISTNDLEKLGAERNSTPNLLRDAHLCKVSCYF